MSRKKPILQYKGGAMTSVQEWQMSGALKEKRLMALRGRWRNASADFLADLLELPLGLVNNLIKSYDEVFAFWKKNKTTDTGHFYAKYLTYDEVKHLLELFDKHYA